MTSTTEMTAEILDFLDARVGQEIKVILLDAPEPFRVAEGILTDFDPTNETLTLDVNGLGFDVIGFVLIAGLEDS